MARFTDSDIKKLDHHLIDWPICIAKNTMYSFSKAEVDWIFETATLKIFEKEENGIPNYLIDPTRSLQEKEFLGIAGELVFSRLLGLSDFSQKDAINNTWCDFHINDDFIDVKTTDKKVPFLNVPAYKKDQRLSPTLYVSIQMINLFTFKFLGCIKSVNVYKDEKLIERGRPYYKTEPIELENYEISHANKEAQA